MATRIGLRGRWLLATVVVLALAPLAQAQAQQPSMHSGVAVAVAANGETTTVTGSIAPTDTVQDGRVNRDGRLHGCEQPTAMPTLFNSTDVHADAIVLQNTHATARCIVVENDFTGCAGGSTQVNAYSSYSPAAPAANIIGATGFSSTGTQAFGFRVAANSAYTLVVHETVNGAGCPAYSLKVTNSPLVDAVTEGVGADAAAITGTVDAFRAALGSNRREITWEEVAEAGADPQNLPLDHYNTTTPRGLVFTAPTQVRVSSDGSGATPAEFGSFHASNAAKYQPFSGVRLFSPTNATVTDFAFRVPGTATPAPTRSFGTVLVSPGTAGYLMPRDVAGDPLGIYVPPAQANGLGFYGLTFATPEIYSMSLSGDYSLGVSNGTVFDDFIYAEPGGTSPAMTMTVTVTGPGSVSATGIQCPGDCSESYAPGTPVGLTAAPTGLAGVSWGGACAGSTGKTCAVTMSEPRSVTATFTDCSPLDAAVSSAERAVKKAKKAVKKAKQAVADADTAAELDQAKAKLAKAKKKLKKAKKQLTNANASLEDCLG